MSVVSWREMPTGVNSCGSKASKTKKDENSVKRRSLGPRGQSQSCHQCRQSIFSTKGTCESQTGKDRRKCGTCTRFWCEKCLENRYGISKGNLGAQWKCPFCLGQCNCSVCRRKEGKLATGILSPLVKRSGYSSVCEFLDKGMGAGQVAQWKTSSLLGSRDSPLKQQTAGSSIGGLCTKSMQLSVEKLHPSLLVRVGASQAPPIKYGTRGRATSDPQGGSKRRRLNHTTYSISVEEDDDGAGDSSHAKFGKHPETTSGKSSGPQTNGTRISSAMEAAQTAGVVTAGGDPLSRRAPLDTRRLSAPLLPSPNSDGSPRGVDRKRKLPGPVAGDGMAQIVATGCGEVSQHEAPIASPKVPHVINVPRPPPAISSTVALGVSGGSQFVQGHSVPVMMQKSCKKDAPHEPTLMEANKVHAASTSSTVAGPSKEPYHTEVFKSPQNEMMIFKEIARDTPATLRDIPATLRDILRDIPATLRDIPATLQDFPATLWNIAATLQDIPAIMLQREDANEQKKGKVARPKLHVSEEREKAKERRKLEREAMKLKKKEEREAARLKLREEKRQKMLEEREKAKERKKEEKEKEKAERERKRDERQRELKELKHQHKKDLAEAVALPSVEAGDEEWEVSPLEDDSVQQCLQCGIPDLPPLTPLDLDIPWGAVPRYLFVCEFLCTFGCVLKLRRAVSLSRLQAMLPNGRGMNDIYQCLLQAVLDPTNHVTSQPPSGHVTSQLLADRKQPRDVEELVGEYLHASGRNGFVSTGSGAQTVEQSLVMLEHLCTEALDSRVISDYIQSSVIKVEEMRRKKRLALKERTKDCSEQLKQLCEDGVPLQELREQRDLSAEKLATLRRKMECDRLKNTLVLRNLPLGTDRHNRVYWKLQCSEGLLVEVVPEHQDTTSSQSSSEVTWGIIANRDEVKEFISCLHPKGRREGPLLEKIRDAVGLYDNYLAKRPTPPPPPPQPPSQPAQ